MGCVKSAGNTKAELWNKKLFGTAASAAERDGWALRRPDRF